MTQTSTIIAGIDVHKCMLVVAVGRCHASESEQEQTRQVEFESRRFGTTQSELQHLSTWLETRGVAVVVMESTAQYWVPVWSVLEPFFELKLAQAWSNRAPRGKKTDFKDAQRLVRRYLADELTLSFVPDSEQREMRTLTRRHKQLAAQRIRIQNQVEALLEQGRIKLSSVISDLFGSSGRRILSALSQGKTDPEELADLGNARLKCGREVLKDALNGKLTRLQQKLLQQYLKQVEVVEEQIKDLAQWTAAAMQPYEEVVVRLTAIPGVQVTAAHQIIAEVGATAAAFASSSRFSSWVGACPGRKESAGENQSSRCARGNRYLRATL
jgi:transposase